MVHYCYVKTWTTCFSVEKLQLLLLITFMSQLQLLITSIMHHILLTNVIYGSWEDLVVDQYKMSTFLQLWIKFYYNKIIKYAFSYFWKVWNFKETCKISRIILLQQIKSTFFILWKGRGVILHHISSIHILFSELFCSIFQQNLMQTTLKPRLLSPISPYLWIFFHPAIDLWLGHWSQLFV